MYNSTVHKSFIKIIMMFHNITFLYQKTYSEFFVKCGYTSLIYTMLRCTHLLGTELPYKINWCLIMEVINLV
jgi:hypothetical protein